MAIAFVQKSSQLFADGSNTIAPSLASVASGNLVVALIAVSFEAFATALNTPAGWNLGVKQDQVGALGYRPGVGIYWKLSTGGTETGSWTIDNNGGSYAAAGIVEFSGILSPTPTDVSTTNSATTATSGNTGTTGATSQADELIITIGHAEDGVGATSSFSSPASSGFTSLWTTSSNAAHIAWDASYKIVAATGTQVGSHTWTTNSDFAGAIATFKATGGGGGGGAVINDHNFRGVDRGIGLGMGRGMAYHQHPMLSLEAYRREQARKHREFMAKVQRAA